jgi:hypothetical protein
LLRRALLLGLLGMLLRLLSALLLLRLLPTLLLLRLLRALLLLWLLSALLLGRPTLRPVGLALLVSLSFVLGVNGYHHSER